MPIILAKIRLLQEQLEEKPVGSMLPVTLILLQIQFLEKLLVTLSLTTKQVWKGRAEIKQVILRVPVWINNFFFNLSKAYIQPESCKGIGWEAYSTATLD